MACSGLESQNNLIEEVFNRTNQQPPHRGGVVPDPVWVGSKWLLAFPRVPDTLDTLLHFFAMLPPERPCEDQEKSISSFRMGLTNLGRALGRSCLLSISLNLLTLSGIPPFSTN